MERTPLYDDLVEQFKDEAFDLEEIVERERWSLAAAKQRAVSEPDCEMSENSSE